VTAVIYCDACGEPVEGRYCRMCGAPAPTAQQAPQQQHYGRHGAGQGGVGQNSAAQSGAGQNGADQYRSDQYGTDQYSAQQYGANQYGAGQSGQYSAGHAAAASGAYNPTSQVPSVQGSLAQAPMAYAATAQFQGDPLTDPLPPDPAQQPTQYVSPAQAAAAYAQQQTQYVQSAPYAQNQAATQYAPAPGSSPAGSPSPFDQNRQATQYLPADQAAGFAQAAGQQAQPQQQPVQYLVPQARQALPTPPAPGDPNFDLLFRGAQGTADDGRTRVLSPVDVPPGMPAPARPTMAVPGVQPYPQPVPGPGGPGGGGGPGGYDDADSGNPNQKMMIWGTFGAVGVVVIIILGLLYLGGGGNSGTPAAAGDTSATATASASPTIGSVTLPSVSASPSASPSPSPSPSPSATGNSSLPLSQGSSGNLVTYVQQRLGQLGYYQGSATGQYDSNTAVSVVSFQAAAHVTADPAGTVGAATLTAIIAAGSTPALKAGGGGHSGGSAADVERLQEALNVAVNAGLTVSGNYTAQTAAAVSAYQSAVGIQPTGAMTAQTWQALQTGQLS
jgi:peptidoglycan hydrolase-like protein with peptidoglycan-binding domain